MADAASENPTENSTSNINPYVNTNPNPADGTAGADAGGIGNPATTAAAGDNPTSPAAAGGTPAAPAATGGNPASPAATGGNPAAPAAAGVNPAAPAAAGANPAAAAGGVGPMPAGLQNVFNNNRNRGGPNNLMNVRDRLFHAIYFKVAIMYAQIFPKPLQRALEWLILLKAVLFFFALFYIHMSFTKNPATCLSHIKDWPRDGVLRVEVIPHLDEKRALLAKADRDEQLVRDLQKNYYYSIGPQTEMNSNRLKEYERKLIRAGYKLRPTYTYVNETLLYYFKTEAVDAEVKQNSIKEYEETALRAGYKLQPAYAYGNETTLYYLKTEDDEQYIVEYSLEYGHLRLSPDTRRRLQIPVRVVQLDPMTNKCFGDKFSKFLLKELLGYDDLLMASVRVIAEREDNKGYLRNVITGEHYRFVSLWWAAWSSYPTAFFVMLLFTFSISMLLRFSHHQIFVFIVDLLQMLEFNVAARFPIAPLLTVILALVGMEAIMSEFFNDTTTAFYIILIVWIADQYDAICCHTSITKRHWLRFFFLYHFAFYAYHYRFSGQNRSLALVTSWLFIQHSMFYFFHHYELPVIMQQVQILIVARNQNDGAANGQQQQQQQQQQQPRVAGGVGAAGQQPNTLQQEQRQITYMLNQIFRRTQQIQQARQQRQQQQIFIPRVGGDAGGGGGGALGAIRRALLARGWAPVRVRVQIGNLQRIQLGSIQINPANLATAAPAATAVGAGAGANGATAAAAARAEPAASGDVAVGAPTTATNNGNVSASTAAAAAATTTTTCAAPAEATATIAATAADVEANLGYEHQRTTSANNSTGVPEAVQHNQIENEQQEKVATLEPQQQQQQRQPMQALNTQNNHKSADVQPGQIADAQATDIALATATVPATTTTSQTAAAGGVVANKNNEDNDGNGSGSNKPNSNLRQLQNELYTKNEKQYELLMFGANGRRATAEIDPTEASIATIAQPSQQNQNEMLQTTRQANQNDHKDDNSILPTKATATAAGVAAATGTVAEDTFSVVVAADANDAAPTSSTAPETNRNFDMIDGGDSDENDFFHVEDSNGNSNSSNNIKATTAAAAVVATSDLATATSNASGSNEFLNHAATSQPSSPTDANSNSNSNPTTNSNFIDDTLYF